MSQIAFIAEEKSPSRISLLRLLRTNLICVGLAKLSRKSRAIMEDRLKNKLFFILYFAALWTFFMFPVKAVAADADSGGGLEKIIESMLSEQDLSQISKEAGGTDFAQLVAEIVTGGIDTGSLKLKERIVNAVTKEFKSNVKGMMQILLIAVITAIFTNFANVFSDSNISEAGGNVSRIAAITVLLAVYLCTERIAINVLSDVIRFIKVLMPAYLSCVAVSSGSLSVAAFSEGVMLMVMMINVLFSRVAVTGGNIYVLIMAADKVTGDGRLDKISKMIMTLMNWLIKTSIAAVIGINLVQGMVVPMADGMQTSMLTRAMKLIPGIGNGVSALSSTVLGAGALIKNGMGAAAVIVIVTICIVPIAKLAMFVVTYQFIGAFTQPICGREFANLVTGFAEAMKLMMSLVIYSMITIFIVIAIICISTNINYQA